MLDENQIATGLLHGTALETSKRNRKEGQKIQVDLFPGHTILKITLLLVLYIHSSTLTSPNDFLYLANCSSHNGLFFSCRNNCTEFLNCKIQYSIILNYSEQPHVPEDLKVLKFERNKS